MSQRHRQLDQRRWALARRAVFDRDGYRCTMCGRAGRLECDHLIPLHVDPGQDPYDIEGLRTLCRICHVQVTAEQNRRPLSDAEREWADLVSELL